jgi:hypothetical protein
VEDLRYLEGELRTVNRTEQLRISPKFEKNSIDVTFSYCSGLELTSARGEIYVEYPAILR